MKKAITILFFEITILTICAAENIPEIVSRITENNIYTSSAVGYAGVKPEQYELYELLISKATSTELIDLLDHENGAVHLFALQGLVERNFSDIDYLNLSIEALSDMRTITTQFGCVGSNYYVGDLVIEMTLSQLDEDEENELLKHALIIRSDLIYAQKALQSDDQRSEFYDYIRAWAIDGNKYALVALSKYRRSEDQEILMTLKNIDESLFFTIIPLINTDDLYSYMENYLDEILPRDHYSSSWRQYYRALASFHNDFSRKMLEKPFGPDVNKNIQKYHIEYIFDAVSEYKDGFYDDFMFILWGRYDEVDVDVFEYLYKGYKDEALSLAIETINNSNKYYYNTKLVRRILDVLKAENIDIREIYINQIKNLSVRLFEVFFEFIDYYWCDELIAVLYQRLSEETNGHIAIPLYQTLSEHGNDETLQRLQSIYESQKGHYKDWSKMRIQDIVYQNGA